MSYPFPRILERENILTEIDQVNTKSLETLIASLLTISIRAISLERLATLDKPELGCRKI
jgi:hypothetical protein